MSKYSVFFLLLTLTFGACQRQDSAGFIEAQAAFDVAENAPPEQQPEAFRKAAAKYEALIENGIKSGAVYYNLGNAYANANEKAKALAAYQLALRYRPLDQHIAANRQTVLGGSAPTQPETPLFDSILFWQDWLGVQTKVIVSLTLTLLTFVLGTFALFHRKHGTRCLAAGSLFLCLVFLVSAAYDWYRFDYTQHAVVAVEQALPRKGHSEKYENAFTAPVPLGSTAAVLYERNNWVFLRFGADREGWLPKQQIVIY
jgi:tetratricopeptide (TPR) repeat protein